MEKLYSVYPWAENPYEERGRKRYLETLKYMREIVKHEWVRERIASRSSVSIVEYCAGTGIGGIALARALNEEYSVKTRLLLVDLREKALEIARRFSRDELGYEADTVVADVTTRLDLGEKYDIALLWGYSTPHFNPWDYVKVLSNIHRSLSSSGLYLYDEVDRIYTIFLVRGYKEVLPENLGTKLVLTIHKSYDSITGYVTRTAYDLSSSEYIDMKVYFWGLADTMTYTWLFFEDIDYMPLRAPYSGVVLAVNPRRDIEPLNYLVKNPRVLGKASQH